MLPDEKDVFRQEWQTPPSRDHKVAHFLEAFSNAPKIEYWLLKNIFATIHSRYQMEMELRPVGEPAALSSNLWKPLIAARRLKTLQVIETIEKLSPLTDEPKMHAYFARVRGARIYSQNAVGASFFSEAGALWAATGEAVDRYSLIHFSPEKYRDASYADVARKAIDIFSFAGISEEKRLRGHSKFNLKYDHNTVFRWIEGRSLTRNKKILIPLQLATFYNRPKNEPVIRPPISTGNAAGQSLNQTIYRGMLEVIERDAFMITWLKKLSPTGLALDTFPRESVSKIDELFHRYNLEVHAFALPTDVPCYVILALIVDRTPGQIFLTVGLRASLNLAEAVEAAIQEAHLMRMEGRNTLVKTEQELPQISESEKIDREARLRLWASRRDLEAHLGFLFSGERKTFSVAANLEFENIDKLETEKKLRHLMNFFRNERIEAAYVENLPHEIRDELPLRCAYVFIPQFQPMHLDETLPYFSGERLQTVPKKLGYDVTDSINRIPHPFP